MRHNVNDHAILGYSAEDDSHRLVGALQTIKTWLQDPRPPMNSFGLPPGFVRQMLVAREKLQATIELAAREYCQADEDLDALSRVLDKLNDRPDPLRFQMEDFRLRLKRRRTEVGRIMKEWGVRISIPKSGDVFDPRYHQVVNSNYDEGDDLDVASVESPLFSWIDECGQPQSIRARVTVCPYYENPEREGVA